MNKYRQAIQNYWEFNNNQCPHYSECKKNIVYKGCNSIYDKFCFDRASVGEYYGENPKLPRIVIIGVEGIHDRQYIECTTAPSLSAGNPHYCGVRYVLSYLLSDFLEKDKPEPRKIKNVVPWIEEALKNYALCNLYCCAFVPENDKERTRNLYHSIEMQENCVERLYNEIKILKPNIVIIQAINPFTDIMRNKFIQYFNIKTDPHFSERKAKLGIGSVENQKCVFVETYHGSTCWFGQKYITNTLNPLLDEVIKKVKEQI